MTTVTLRKANALQNSINDVIRTIAVTTDVNINEFQDAEQVIKQAREALLENLARRDQLNAVLYEIRKAVSEANAGVGVSERLATIAEYDKLIKNYTDLASATVRESAEVVAGKLNRLRNATGEVRLYGREAVGTSVLDSADIAGFKSQLAQAKKAKQKLQDEVLELNVRTEITLSDAAVQALTTEGIL